MEVKYDNSFKNSTYNYSFCFYHSKSEKTFQKKVGDKMTTKEVSEKYGICIATAARWAKNNGVQRGEIVNGIMPFNWTDEDCLRFEQRQSKGWKKGVPRHND